MNEPMQMKLVPDVNDVELRSLRLGFGQGLLDAALADAQIVGLCADLCESTKMDIFARNFPERYFDVGVAEQNLVTVAAGMAAAGRRPFVSSYAAFSPGRNWEQIRTTICLNDQPVTIVGSHAGVSVGPDGATHQMLEDIALMRVLPNMIVVAPGDALEAHRATVQLAKIYKPSYLRLSRESTPVFTTINTPFEIGKAYVLWAGSDITILSTGIMTYNCLVAAKKLQTLGISVEVVHVPTIKPLDAETIFDSVGKTGRAITVEESQVAAGFGGAIMELLSEKPVPLRRLGVNDRFGESGTSAELFAALGLDQFGIIKSVRDFLDK